jgi:hypothetical protein
MSNEYFNVQHNINLITKTLRVCYKLQAFDITSEMYSNNLRQIVHTSNYSTFIISQYFTYKIESCYFIYHNDDMKLCISQSN